MSVPTPSCPNCGTAWPPESRFCPLCGFMRPLPAAWPPPIAGLIAPPLLASQRMTGNAGGDVAVGLGICFAPWPVMMGLSHILGSSIYYSVLLLAPPVLYFVLRPRYPFVARGLGYGFLLSLILTPILLVLGVVLLVLGVLSLCKSSFPN